MEKVKLTKEQAEAIENYKDGKESMALAFRVKTMFGYNKCLNDLSLDELARALYIGYEVEPEFKVGDWVVNENLKKVGKIEAIKELNLMTDADTTRIFVDSIISYPDALRHATESEIAEEKERRWWSKHGRGVWELKKGDLLISNTDRFSCDVKFVEASDGSGSLLVNGVKDEFLESKDDVKGRYDILCFRDSRLDGGEQP